MYRIGFTNVDILDFTSHYCINMPCLLMGSVFRQDRIYEALDRKIMKRCSGHKILNVTFILFGIIGVEALIHNQIGITSNMDFVYVAVVIYCNIVFLRAFEGDVIIKKILGWLGKKSLYIWLIHSIWLETCFQHFTYALRIPAIIVVSCFIVIIPIVLSVEKITAIVLRSTKR